MADPLTILCVDDEERALFLRKAVLQKFGFDVLPASSAREALDILDNNHVDLVLSDLLMPGVPGTELAKEVKGKYPDLPVVIVSGVNEIPPDASYADLFVSKLDGPVALCDQLRKILGVTEAPA